jgi:hypothetical protein
MYLESMSGVTLALFNEELHTAGDWLFGVDEPQREIHLFAAKSHSQHATNVSLKSHER